LRSGALRDAWIGPRAAAVLAEEPRQIRRAVLRVAVEIFDVEAAEIAKDQRAAWLTSLSVAQVRTEQIVRLAHMRWDIEKHWFNAGQRLAATMSTVTIQGPSSVLTRGPSPWLS